MGDHFVDFHDFQEQTGGTLEDWMAKRLEASSASEAEESPEERERRIFQEKMREYLKGPAQ